MKAVAVVAHPDDCVIFAWPFIEAHPEFKWSVLYLTYMHYQPRGKEVSEYWRKRNIPAIFLGYDDVWESVKNGDLGFNADQAEQEIASISSEYDLILTHNEDGDYGHIHHKFVNRAVNKNDVPKVYFASTFNYNTKYTAQTAVDPLELPLHRNVIEQFQDRNSGLYIVTPEAELLLKKKNENTNVR